MNEKNIAKALKAKLDDWMESIDDEKIVKIIKENAIITGGAIVNLLNDEMPNDYDVYFKTHEAVVEIAKYYAHRWKEGDRIEIVENTDLFDLCNNVENGLCYDRIINNDFSNVPKEFIGKINNLLHKKDKRVTMFIKSSGVIINEDESCIDDETEPNYELSQIYETEPYTSENKEEPTQPNPEITKPKYRPRYFSTNALSLSDKIQIIIRFYGSIEDIHKNYDYIHCTCSYDYETNKVNLPQKALISIINKELNYEGSKYPLCSIIRSRKFIARGWKLNAGQYVKMALQLNELNLKDLNVFKDQLTGVDSAYFNQAIDLIIKKQKEDPYFTIDNNYLFEIINRIF